MVQSISAKIGLIGHAIAAIVSTVSFIAALLATVYYGVAGARGWMSHERAENNVAICIVWAFASGVVCGSMG